MLDFLFVVVSFVKNYLNLIILASSNEHRSSHLMGFICTRSFQTRSLVLFNPLTEKTAWEAGREVGSCFAFFIISIFQIVLLLEDIFILWLVYSIFRLFIV